MKAKTGKKEIKDFEKLDVLSELLNYSLDVFPEGLDVY
jgi:hypothetical protein